jgi:hypothetical protein
VEAAEHRNPRADPVNELKLDPREKRTGLTMPSQV